MKVKFFKNKNYTMQIGITVLDCKKYVIFTIVKNKNINTNNTLSKVLYLIEKNITSILL